MILIYLIGFSIFAVLQSICINGIHDCFKGKRIVDNINHKIDHQGMIFYMMAPKFFERNRHKAWVKPLWGCVRCMASFWGAVTYWPSVIYSFGFRWVQVPVFIADVFILVYLNNYFYKKL